jgi:hypothetical protein
MSTLNTRGKTHRQGVWAAPARGYARDTPASRLYLPDEVRDGLDRLCRLAVTENRTVHCRADVIREVLVAYLRQHL